MFEGKTILVTGGTGSFGSKFTEHLLKNYSPKKIIIFSRDEFKQSEMAKRFSQDEYPIRYFLGDIRDRDRLFRAFEGVDYVIHAAALKQVPALEYNPSEAIKTNVDGSNNIVNAAIDAGVKKVVALSTDKAVNPSNLYGATKLVAEKIFVAANAYAGSRVKFAAVRYGNVMGSRGSVIPLFLSLKDRGIVEFPITDEEMTRFWLTLDQSVDIVLQALEHAEGGEIFVPRIPSMHIKDLAKAINPKCTFKTVGIRPGEKLHEALISEDESRSAKVWEHGFVILPQFNETEATHKKWENYEGVSDRFLYSSESNDQWLSIEELKDMIALM